MFSALRTRYGIPGIIATAALVFAMTGGAFAAKYLITSTNQIKPSVLKKLKGATGPAGAQGPAGAAGAKGDTGAQGKEGGQGPKGEKGAQGAPGKEGSPWTTGGTLPPGETLTGTYAVGETTLGEVGAISFPFPLPTPLGSAEVHAISTGDPIPGECTDEATPEAGPANPEADPGHLCVFQGGSGTQISGIFKASVDIETFPFGADATGAVVFQQDGWGAWAVTAPVGP